MKDWTTDEKLEFLKHISNEEVAKGLAAQGLKIDWKAIVEAMGLTGVLVEQNKPVQLNHDLSPEDPIVFTTVTEDIDKLKGSLESYPVRELLIKVLNILLKMESARQYDKTMFPIFPIQKYVPLTVPNTPPNWTPVPAFKPLPQWGNTNKIMMNNVAASDATGYVEKTTGRSWAGVEGDPL